MFCECPFALHRQQPEKGKQNFDVDPHGKISADAHGCTDFDLILRSSSVMLFGSILLNHSKTINAKVVRFLNLYANQNLYNFDAW